MTVSSNATTLSENVLCSAGSILGLVLLSKIKHLQTSGKVHIQEEKSLKHQTWTKKKSDFLTNNL